MKIVEREIDARERAAATSCWSGKKQSRELPTAATLMSTDSSPSCAYCDQAHHSSQCRVVTDVRKGMLMKAERCFLCMKKGNLSKKCRSSSKCSTCHRRHHNSIYDNGNATSEAKPTRPAVSITFNAQGNTAQCQTGTMHHPNIIFHVCQHQNSRSSTNCQSYSLQAGFTNNC